MGSRTIRLSEKASLPFKTANKQRRQELHIKRKKATDALRRAERFARRKEEDKNPKLREARLRQNVPQTLDSKRVWDEVDDEPEDAGLGVAYNVERMKRRRLEAEQQLPEEEAALDIDGREDEDTTRIQDEEHDSMLDDSSEEDDNEPLDDDDDDDENAANDVPLGDQMRNLSTKARASSPTRSTTSTNLSLAPAALTAKFPSLFASYEEGNAPTSKILLTTSINSTLHREAELLTSLFPNTTYIRRSSHRYGHKFSVREIASFASNRAYTAVIVLEEDLKRPKGMTIVHLPAGPTLHFSISNWYDGKAIPGHGRAVNAVPELILNNFVTPLGLLTAQIFRSLFPVSPELQGRQVVTLHNQRDFIFLRRHRYVFREKRETEKAVVGADGREMRGAEGIRAGLQEIGPRFTLKLRRVDKGIQRSSGQEWEWKGKTDRIRTKFQL